MSNIRELNFDEIAIVSGGESMMSAANRGDHIGHQASTNYGGQANGFQSNVSAGLTGANMYNDVTSPCGASIIGGMTSIAGSALSGNAASIGLSAIGAATSIASTCNFNSSSNTPFR
jgi:hypothetical protein